MISRIMVSDWMKMKGTWIPYLVLLGPFGVILMQALNYHFRYGILVRPDSDVWKDLLENIHFLMIPTMLLGITLLASMMSGLEHQGHTWKSLLALPFSRIQFYLSKLLWLFVFLLIPSVLIIGGTALLGLWLGFGPDVPWQPVVQQGFYPFLAALPIMVIQLWISIMVQNQAISITIGVVGTICSFVSSLLPKALPWLYPTLAAPFHSAQPVLYVWIGLGVGIVLFAISSAIFAKRDVM